MKRVCIESPLRGDRDLNKLYARVCALDCLVRGESPYASHLLFDHEDLLDDAADLQRDLGIRAGFAWGGCAELRVFYLDLGESGGMKLGRDQARERDPAQPTEDRRLINPAVSLTGWPRYELVNVLRNLRFSLLKQLHRNANER